jgi:hypothetical protein
MVDTEKLVFLYDGARQHVGDKVTLEVEKSPKADSPASVSFLMWSLIEVDELDPDPKKLKVSEEITKGMATIDKEHPNRSFDLKFTVGPAYYTVVLVAWQNGTVPVQAGHVTITHRRFRVYSKDN